MTSPAASGTQRTWQAVAVGTAFLTLFSVVGCALYGLPFFYDFLVRDLGWTRQQVTSGNALSKLIVGPAFGFLAGWLVDRLGPRRLMLAGVVMAGCAVFGLSTVTGFGAFYFFYFLNALGYVCGGPLPNQVLLSRWFDTARGKAMGIGYLGIGVGGALVPLLAHAFIQSLGWRGALQALGLLMIVVALPAALVVREPPAPPATAGTADGARLGPILRQPAFYLLAFGSMASIGAVGGTVQNLKLYFSLDRHLPQAEIAGILSLSLWGSIVGRLLVGWLADRWPKKRVMLIVYAIVAGTIPLLATAPTPLTLKVAAFLFGVGLGGDYMMIPLIAAELFGVRAIGRLLGVVLTADGVAEAGAPLLVAALRDRTGSYEAGFWLLVALAVAGAVAVSRLPSTRNRLSQPG
jgi:sugar phosphate permease